MYASGFSEIPADFYQAPYLRISESCSVIIGAVGTFAILTVRVSTLSLKKWKINKTNLWN